MLLICSMKKVILDRMNRLKNFWRSCAALAAILLSTPIFAQHYGMQQLIPAGHWLYDSIYALQADAGITSLADNAPLTAAELRMYLQSVPYEKLSDTGKKLYDTTKEFFSTPSWGINFGPVRASLNVVVKPELLYKSNSDIPWPFGRAGVSMERTATGTLDSSDKDHPKINWTKNSDGNFSRLEKFEYGSASNCMGNDLLEPLGRLELALSVGDYLTMEVDPCIAKNFWGMADGDNFVNIPLDYNQVEFYWPFTAYASAGKYWDKGVGLNVSVARQGLQIGRTQTGSVIYNSTFQTDFYAQINLYSRHVKYNLDVAQMSKDRYLYLHYIEAAPFKWAKLGFAEGTLINAPFELRFLNPFMIMHSLGIWSDGDYDKDPLDAKLYGESHVAAYMAFSLDIVPCRFLRIYALYAQNEIQSKVELGSANGRSFPDSFGVQAGVEVTLPEGRNDGFWTFTLEGIYTTPFCYVKQEATGSLMSWRYDMHKNGSMPICSWIGTPFGPDSIGAQTRAVYTKPRKWSCELQYLFLAHGANSFNLFGNYVEIDGVKYYTYYPSVLRRLRKEYSDSELGLDNSDAKKIAREHKLSGTVEFTNAITVKGSYKINRHLDAAAEATVVFVVNSGNKSGAFDAGVTLATSLKYTVF